MIVVAAGRSLNEAKVTNKVGYFHRFCRNEHLKCFLWQQKLELDLLSC